MVCVMWCGMWCGMWCVGCDGVCNVMWDVMCGVWWCVHVVRNVCNVMWGVMVCVMWCGMCGVCVVWIKVKRWLSCTQPFTSHGWCVCYALQVCCVACKRWTYPPRVRYGVLQGHLVPRVRYGVLQGHLVPRVRYGVLQGHLVHFLPATVPMKPQRSEAKSEGSSKWNMPPSPPLIFSATGGLGRPPSTQGSGMVCSKAT